MISAKLPPVNQFCIFVVEKFFLRGIDHERKLFPWFFLDDFFFIFDNFFHFYFPGKAACIHQMAFSQGLQSQNSPRTQRTFLQRSRCKYMPCLVREHWTREVLVREWASVLSTVLSGSYIVSCTIKTRNDTQCAIGNFLCFSNYNFNFLGSKEVFFRKKLCSKRHFRWVSWFTKKDHFL